MIHFGRYKSTAFLVLGAYGSQRQTQLTGVPQISKKNTDWNKFKHQGLFGFLFYPLKLHFSITGDKIIARGTVL